MTDNEIIKALECCADEDASCSECPIGRDYDCRSQVCSSSLEIINRQKAEIERLTDLINEIAEANEDLVRDNHDLYVSLKNRDAEIEEQDQAILRALKRMGEIRAEAYKEFAERLKEIDEYVSPLDIDNLVKEMTEGQI